MKKFLSIIFLLALTFSIVNMDTWAAINSDSNTSNEVATKSDSNTSSETDKSTSSNTSSDTNKKTSKKTKKKKIVVIDAGHQRYGMNSTEPIGPGSSQRKAKVTGGASGCVSGLAEYQLNLIVAKKLQKELKKRGYKVYMCRTKHNVKISNVWRAKYANKKKADVFIRIHANSSASKSVKGALTIAPTNSNKYMKKKIIKSSQKLSKSILKKYCKVTKAKNRGVMYTDTMTGINWCKVPVSIIEMGFMSNPSEDRKMASSKYQKKIVKGIADGIDAYLK